jgi:hypothetical protein
VSSQDDFQIAKSSLVLKPFLSEVRSNFRQLQKMQDNFFDQQLSKD